MISIQRKIDLHYLDHFVIVQCKYKYYEVFISQKDKKHEFFLPVLCFVHRLCAVPKVRMLCVIVHVCFVCELFSAFSIGRCFWSTNFTPAI